MKIGFTLKEQTVPEIHRNYIIEISSNVESGRDHPIKIDLLLAKSNATIGPSDYADVFLRNITGLELAKGMMKLNITAHLAEDEMSEGTECFYLRISPKDAYRHDFMCGKNPGDGHWCVHKFCIADGGKREFTKNTLCTVFSCPGLPQLVLLSL